MGAIRAHPVPRMPAVTEAVGWEHVPHGADIGVHGWGPHVTNAFEQAALALTAIVVEPSSVQQRTSIQISCEAASLEDLFIEWLNAVIFEMASRRMVFGRFNVAIVDNRLMASASGEALDPDRHEPAIEPKGATYTMLQVAQHKDGSWHAQCVVDV
jgi:SHS2 domain-containing protein